MTNFLLPPSIDEWLPQRHLARFVVEVIDGLDLTAMSRAYRGTGSASYHPAPLLGLLVYGYATGVFSSRKIEQATQSSNPTKGACRIRTWICSGTIWQLQAAPFLLTICLIQE